MAEATTRIDREKFFLIKIDIIIKIRTHVDRILIYVLLVNYSPRYLVCTFLAILVFVRIFMLMFCTGMLQ